MIRMAELMLLAMKEVNFHIGFVEVMSARYRAHHEALSSGSLDSQSNAFFRTPGIYSPWWVAPAFLGNLMRRLTLGAPQHYLGALPLALLCFSGFNPFIQLLCLFRTKFNLGHHLGIS